MVINDVPNVFPKFPAVPQVVPINGTLWIPYPLGKIFFFGIIASL
jgi:hypothetical protein